MRRSFRVLLLAPMLLLVLGATLVPVFAQDAPEEASEQVQGTIQAKNADGDNEPIPGVSVEVADADGNVVGTAVSDDDGRWNQGLPAPGVYSATIDISTLPEGVELRNVERDTLDVTIRPNQKRTVIFALGEDTRNIGSRLDEFLQLTVEGVKFGLIIAMSAIGLSLIFGTTGLVNFAHGELVTLGGLITWFFNRTIGMHLILAAVLGIIVTSAAGGLIDLGLWRPLRKRKSGLIAMMVVSIGLSLVARYIFLYQFGGRTQPYKNYNLQRAWDIGPVAVAPKDLWIMGLSVIVLIGVGLLLQFTKMGKAMRAVSDNPDLAESSGIDVERVILMVWVLGSGLACLGGIFFGLGEQVSFQYGFQLLLLMFAGVTLGGLGTAYGALVGSFIIGLLVQVSTLWVSTELKNVGALLILILILLVRPQGLLGRAERVG